MVIRYVLEYTSNSRIMKHFGRRVGFEKNDFDHPLFFDAELVLQVLKDKRLQFTIDEEENKFVINPVITDQKPNWLTVITKNNTYVFKKKKYKY